jgi:hypothetical protein
LNTGLNEAAHLPNEGKIERLFILQMEATMSVETLSLAAGALLSLLFGYVPGLSGWFGAKDSVVKRLIMAAALLAISIAVFGLSCAGLQIPGVQLECSTQGAWLLLQVFLLALVANQSMYSITSVSATKKAASGS